MNRVARSSGEAEYTPTLILIRGIPGSGKSYVALALQDAIGKDRVTMLDPDATDYASQEYADFSRTLAAEGVETELYPYRFLRSKAHTAITAHKIIIWNQAFTSLDGFNRTVVNLQAYAREHGLQLPVLVVEVEIDEAVAKARVAKRHAQGGHGVSPEAFDRFMHDYKSFADEGYAPVVVDGEADVAVSVAAIMKALADLRRPTAG